ncbi:MAG: transcriptional regulator [Terricaulis sp.]
MSRFDHTEIDDVIHGRLRLGIMAYLSTVSPVPFVELKAKVNATDGNLSAHLSKLEEAGYVRLDKSFIDKKPRTNVQLTPSGRKAWIEYLNKIQGLLSAAE